MTDDARLTRDDLGIVAGGLVALGAAFLPWYESRGGDARLRGWDLGFVALVAVLLAAYAGLRPLLYRARPPKPDVPVTPQGETFFWSLVATAMMLYRVLDAPTLLGEPAVRTIGIVVAGLAILVQFVCAARTIGRTGVRVKQ